MMTRIKTDSQPAKHMAEGNDRDILRVIKAGN